MAHALSSSYDHLQVVGSERNVMIARLSLYSAARQVLNNGMRVLGLSPVERYTSPHICPPTPIYRSTNAWKQDVSAFYSVSGSCCRCPKGRTACSFKWRTGISFCSKIPSRALFGSGVFALRGWIRKFLGSERGRSPDVLGHVGLSMCEGDGA